MSAARRGAYEVQIKISIRHGHLNDNHQQQIRAKAEKLLHFFNRLTIIEVTIDLKDENSKEVEFHARAEHKHEFVAKDRHSDLMAAVDLALDRVSHQIHKYKERLQDHRRDQPTSQIAGLAKDNDADEE
jgi:putative sigma-54 modulation protein